MLADALRSGQVGTTAVAADVIASSPGVASVQGADSQFVRPDPDVVEALEHALSQPWPPDAVETIGAVAEASGALQLLAFKPRIEERCQGAVRGLAERFRRALTLLGDGNPGCVGGATLASAPPVLGTKRQVRLEFSTDVGPLTMILNGDLAPAAGRRVIDLVEKGFYSGVVVHRMIPGFIVQFGDPGGDGYGGAGLPPLPSETTPLPFVAGSVGLALSGADTGSSQLFVTLGAFPHLDGDYPLIGQAGPGWEKLDVGDAIHSVRVVAE